MTDHVEKDKDKDTDNDSGDLQHMCTKCKKVDSTLLKNILSEMKCEFNRTPVIDDSVNDVLGETSVNSSEKSKDISSITTTVQSSNSSEHNERSAVSDNKLTQGSAVDDNAVDKNEKVKRRNLNKHPRIVLKLRTTDKDSPKRKSPRVSNQKGEDSSAPCTIKTSDNQLTGGSAEIDNTVNENKQNEKVKRRNINKKTSIVLKLQTTGKDEDSPKRKSPRVSNQQGGGANAPYSIKTSDNQLTEVSAVDDNAVDKSKNKIIVPNNLINKIRKSVSYSIDKKNVNKSEEDITNVTVSNNSDKPIGSDNLEDGKENNEQVQTRELNENPAIVLKLRTTVKDKDSPKKKLRVSKKSARIKCQKSKNSTRKKSQRSEKSTRTKSQSEPANTAKRKLFNTSNKPRRRSTRLREKLVNNAGTTTRTRIIKTRTRITRTMNRNRSGRLISSHSKSSHKKLSLTSENSMQESGSITVDNKKSDCKYNEQNESDISKSIKNSSRNKLSDNGGISGLAAEKEINTAFTNPLNILQQENKSGNNSCDDGTNRSSLGEKEISNALTNSLNRLPEEKKTKKNLNDDGINSVVAEKEINRASINSLRSLQLEKKSGNILSDDCTNSRLATETEISSVSTNSLNNLQQDKKTENILSDDSTNSNSIVEKEINSESTNSLNSLHPEKKSGNNLNDDVMSSAAEKENSVSANSLNSLQQERKSEESPAIPEKRRKMSANLPKGDEEMSENQTDKNLKFSKSANS